MYLFIMFRCPKNFISIHKTYDLDSDADLWRETNMFGKKTGRGRYLCISKTEGLPEYVIETLKYVIKSNYYVSNYFI